MSVGVIENLPPEQLTQEAVPMSDWPYQPDWIIDELVYDRRRRSFWVEGTNLNYGPSDPSYRFFWELRADRPLSWRYDLRNTVYKSKGE